MGSFWSTAPAKPVEPAEVVNIDETLGKICIALKDRVARDGIQHNVQSSLNYLARPGVAKKFVGLCNELHIEYVNAVYAREILDIVYVELEAESDTGKKYMMNFWPCTHCDCIEVKEI